MRQVFAKIIALMRDVAHHFLAVEAFLNASALAYTTIISIVPLMMLSIGIMSAFSSIQIYNEIISDFLFRHFVPSSAETIHRYIELYATQASRLSAAGLLFSVVGAVFLLFTIESTFNTIWHVKKSRNGLQAFLLYWAILTLLPPAVAAAFGATIFLYSLPYISSLISVFSSIVPVLMFVPYIITWCCFAFLYKTLPNTHVPFKYAAIGAAIAALIFEGLKVSFGFYVAHLSTYNEIYGAIAAIPIFLFWLYLSWLVVILGAVIANVVGTPKVVRG